MSPVEVDIVAFERDRWKEKDWVPAITSFLTRLFFLPLLRMRDAARPRPVVVKALTGLAFYPLYLRAIAVWPAASLLLLPLRPFLSFPPTPPHATPPPYHRASPAPPPL